MSIEEKQGTSRRDFLVASGSVVAASALPSFGFANVHAEGKDLVQVALVGCGGRGGGAAANALRTKGGPIKLVAVADVFQDRLDSTRDELMKSYSAQLDLPKERQFVGFDAYKQAMDCLKPGDVVILTTPPAFRWVHFKYAISKKLNVFMEKPVTVDGPTSQRMLKLADEAQAAGLKVGVGLMSRHAKPLQELHKRIQDGQLGEIMYMRGYRMHGPAASSQSTAKPAEMTDVEYQIRRFHSFLWASGGCFNDFYIHIIDHLSWMKNSWPVSAQAVGGRHYKMNKAGKPFIDQNFDSYSVEYTFADGTKFFFDGRCIEGAEGIFSSYIHGTKGLAIASSANDCGAPSSIFKTQKAEGTPEWISTDRSNPYQNEWTTLMDAIRNGKPHNEVKRGVETSVVSSMGRMAAHTGRIVTFDEMLNCTHEFAPDVDKMTLAGPAPVMPDEKGHFPMPQPGILTTREY